MPSYFKDEVSVNITRYIEERNGKESIQYYYHFVFGPAPPEGGSRTELSQRSSYKTEESVLESIKDELERKKERNPNLRVKEVLLFEGCYRIQITKKVLSEDSIRILSSLEEALKR